MSFEDQIQQSMFKQKSEKTFLDKVYGRQDVESIRALMKKQTLSRSDLLELLYLMSSVESKLHNYDERDRYVILKFFVWIRSMVNACEILFDYQEYLKKSKVKLTDRTQKMIENNVMYLEHNIKFMVDLYLNISRTTLSLGGVGFLEPLKNRFELNYQTPQPTQLQEKKKWGIF